MTLPKITLAKILYLETGKELIYSYTRADVLLENKKLKEEVFKR
jgi:hypothetical protein